jgi:hypothetical protein
MSQPVKSETPETPDVKVELTPNSSISMEKDIEPTQPTEIVVKERMIAHMDDGGFNEPFFDRFMINLKGLMNKGQHTFQDGRYIESIMYFELIDMFIRTYGGNLKNVTKLHNYVLHMIKSGRIKYQTEMKIKTDMKHIQELKQKYVRFLSDYEKNDDNYKPFSREVGFDIQRNEIIRMLVYPLIIDDLYTYNRSKNIIFIHGFEHTSKKYLIYNCIRELNDFNSLNINVLHMDEYITLKEINDKRNETITSSFELLEYLCKSGNLMANETTSVDVHIKSKTIIVINQFTKIFDAYQYDDIQTILEQYPNIILICLANNVSTSNIDVTNEYFENQIFFDLPDYAERLHLVTRHMIRRFLKVRPDTNDTINVNLNLISTNYSEHMVYKHLQKYIDMFNSKSEVIDVKTLRPRVSRKFGLDDQVVEENDELYINRLLTEYNYLKYVSNETFERFAKEHVIELVTYVMDIKEWFDDLVESECVALGVSKDKYKIEINDPLAFFALIHFLADVTGPNDNAMLAGYIYGRRSSNVGITDFGFLLQEIVNVLNVSDSEYVNLKISQGITNPREIYDNFANINIDNILNSFSLFRSKVGSNDRYMNHIEYLIKSHQFNNYLNKARIVPIDLEQFRKYVDVEITNVNEFEKQLKDELNKMNEMNIYDRPDVRTDIFSMSIYNEEPLESIEQMNTEILREIGLIGGDEKNGHVRKVDSVDSVESYVSEHNTTLDESHSDNDNDNDEKTHISDNGENEKHENESNDKVELKDLKFNGIGNLDGFTPEQIEQLNNAYGVGGSTSVNDEKHEHSVSSDVSDSSSTNDNDIKVEIDGIDLNDDEEKNDEDDGDDDSSSSDDEEKYKEDKKKVVKDIENDDEKDDSSSSENDDIDKYKEVDGKETEHEPPSSDSDSSSSSPSIDDELKELLENVDRLDFDD